MKEEKKKRFNRVYSILKWLSDKFMAFVMGEKLFLLSFLLV